MNYHISIEQMKKSYAEFELFVDFKISAHELISIVGPSGCGKSTTLSLITGLIEPDEGAVLIDGDDITGLPVWERNIGFVFQDYALFPHMNVKKNIAYGLKLAKESTTIIDSSVESLLETIQLQGYGSRDIESLSGGERQRVALARAVAPHPHLLLLDEPLSALDAKLRISLRKEIQRIHKELELTTLYVTHDQEEALAISDRIIVMNNGRIEQIGTPEEIYHEPASRFVAQFIGSSNIIEESEYPDTCLFFRPEALHIDDDTVTEKTHRIYRNATLSYQEFSGQYYCCTFTWNSQLLIAYSSSQLDLGKNDYTLSVAHDSVCFIN